MTRDASEAIFALTGVGLFAFGLFLLTDLVQRRDPHRGRWLIVTVWLSWALLATWAAAGWQLRQFHGYRAGLYGEQVP